MRRDEMRLDEPAAPGEYYRMAEVSESRIKMALDRAKQEVTEACLRLEAFLQGEAYIHGVDCSVGSMSDFIRDETAMLEEKASDTMLTILRRVDQLERGSCEMPGKRPPTR